MHIKVINPKTNGKNAYSNRGSARQAANYLAHEAKQVGEKAEFFSSEQVRLTGDEAVAMLDNNRKGLRADEAKFYSLVISPSDQELAHIGNDPVKLRAYTRDVMHAYAENFNLKDGRKLAEKDLVWVATQHNERTARGTDNEPSGTKKDGLQTHIHLMVSARDREQKITLNPLGTVQRFNQVRFSAAGNVIFGQKFDYGKPAYTSARTDRNVTAVPREVVNEKEAFIRERMAVNKRKTRPERQLKGAAKEQSQEPTASRLRDRSQRAYQKLSPAQEGARDERLAAQVERINKKLPEATQLDFQKVKEAAQARDYDKTFYGRLGRIGREANAGRIVDSPYDLLQTGKVKKPENTVEITSLNGPSQQNSKLQKVLGGAVIATSEPEKKAPVRPRPGQSAGKAAWSKLNAVGSAMDPNNRNQDVRGQWERN